MSEPEKKLVCCALAGLKHVRLSRRMSQRRLADWIGVGAKVVSRYESEEIVPRLCHLKAMCRVLKCQLWELFFDPEQHYLAA